jgi:hypothetical protein
LSLYICHTLIAPANADYISQLIRSSGACRLYTYFLQFQHLLSNKPLSQGFLNLILSYLAKGFCWWYNIFETYSVTCAHNYDEIWYWINRGIINNIMAKIKTRKGQITTLSKAIQLNTGGARKCRRRVSRSCSRDSGIRRVTLVKNQELSHEWGKDRIVVTTNETYPWSFEKQISITVKTLL